MAEKHCDGYLQPGIRCELQPGHPGPHHAHLAHDEEVRGPQVRAIDWPKRERAVDEGRETR